jgi:hypothetical protein
MIWRLLNVQGLVGLAVSSALAIALVAAHVDLRHWRKQSHQYERLWAREKAAHQATVANHLRAALESAEADTRNLQRVRSEQAAISQRIAHDYEVRIADARAAADRLRRQAGAPATHSGGGSATPVPGSGASAGGAADAAAQDGFPLSDRLIATEQAIQLQSLIDWVEAQSKVDNSGYEPSIPQRD